MLSKIAKTYDSDDEPSTSQRIVKQNRPKVSQFVRGNEAKGAPENSNKTESDEGLLLVTMFDRSLLIGAHNRNNTLYELVREWFKNEPQNSVEMNSIKVKNPFKQRTADGQVDVEMFKTMDMADIDHEKVMAPLRSTNLSRIPPCPKQEGEPSSLNPTDLLEYHLVYWKQVKKAWIQHRRKYIWERCGHNFAMIDAMRQYSAMRNTQDHKRNIFK